jgi:hypothetical protein
MKITKRSDEMKPVVVCRRNIIMIHMFLGFNLFRRPLINENPDDAASAINN